MRLSEAQSDPMAISARARERARLSHRRGLISSRSSAPHTAPRWPVKLLSRLWPISPHLETRQSSARPSHPLDSARRTTGTRCALALPPLHEALGPIAD